ncbi:aspartate/glutamate racemase family protein [Roseovarius aestuarii]|nr:aspartate/glutamate racemase family protein [Roseovarius aestuarii]
MRLHLLNPNGTASMTTQALGVARQVAGPGTQIVATTGNGVVGSVEGHADAARVVPAMLDTIAMTEREDPGVDAHILACFDDPGLHAAREVASSPVIGMAEASMQVAGMIAARFSIITTLPRSALIIDDLVELYGFTRACAQVRAVDLPVLSLETAPERTEKLLLREIAKAIREDRAEAIILGCMGMAEIKKRLSEATGLPIVDGVTAGIAMAEAIVRSGYRTSKTGGFAYPRDKSGD